MNMQRFLLRVRIDGQQPITTRLGYTQGVNAERQLSSLVASGQLPYHVTLDGGDGVIVSYAEVCAALDRVAQGTDGIVVDQAELPGVIVEDGNPPCVVMRCRWVVDAFSIHDV